MPGMIALEVTLNGKRVCIAGAEDLSVLTAHVTASGKLGKKTVPAWPGEAWEVFYRVGGLTSRQDATKDVHVKWQDLTPLKIGDVIEIKILETSKADRAKSRKRAKR